MEGTATDARAQWRAAEPGGNSRVCESEVYAGTLLHYSLGQVIPDEKIVGQEYGSSRKVCSRAPQQRSSLARGTMEQQKGSHSRGPVRRPKATPMLTATRTLQQPQRVVRLRAGQQGSIRIQKRSSSVPVLRLCTSDDCCVWQSGPLLSASYYGPSLFDMCPPPLIL